MLYIFTPDIIELSGYLSLLNRVKTQTDRHTESTSPHKVHHIKKLLKEQEVHDFRLITTLTISDIDYSSFSH